jgi:hypothetical protein
MCDEAAQYIHITQQIIREMTDRGLFYLESIVIPVTSEKAIVTIHLHLNDERVIQRSQSGFPISGFPRVLADGELLKKICKYTTSSTTFLQKLKGVSFPSNTDKTGATQNLKQTSVSSRKAKGAQHSRASSK